MTKHDQQLSLLRIDPRKNMCRFYALALQPNLFGEASLVRSWGRIGSVGQLRIDLFENEAAARLAFERVAQTKRRRGYVGPDGHDKT